MITEMKKLQKLSVTTAMVFVITCSTFAGDLGSDRMAASDLGSDFARAGDLGSDRAKAGDLGSDVATYVMDLLYALGIL